MLRLFLTHRLRNQSSSCFYSIPFLLRKKREIKINAINAAIGQPCGGLEHSIDQ